MAFRSEVLEATLPVLVAVCAAGCATNERWLTLLTTWAPQATGRLIVVFNSSRLMRMGEDFVSQRPAIETETSPITHHLQPALP